jgi:lipoprotein Spr
MDCRFSHREQRILRSGGVSFILAAIFIVWFLQGCSSKVQVTYVPHEKRQVRGEYQIVDKETVVLLKRHYERWRGTPYSDGGMSTSGVDCSGFTVLAYRELFDLSLPRTAGEQAASGREVTREALKPGDLIFFSTGLWKKHVGIYLADDQFIHASLSRGVTISSLDDSYWQEKYWQARRMQAPERLSKADSVAAMYR